MLLRSRRINMYPGEAMSRTLGISRAAVWKAIEALRQEGYTIQSAPNRGVSAGQRPRPGAGGELTGPLAGCHVGGKLLCLDTGGFHQHRVQAPGHGRSAGWVGGHQ